MSDRHRNANIMDLAAFGFFLISVGAVFLAVPDIADRLVNFFQDFSMQQLAPNLYLPAPLHYHPHVYFAFFVFCVVFGLLHIPLLAGRFWTNDRLRKKTRTLGSIIFWLGMAYISNLLVSQSIGWFDFVGLFLIWAGVTVITENAIVLAAPKKVNV